MEDRMFKVLQVVGVSLLLIPLVVLGTAKAVPQAGTDRALIAQQLELYRDAFLNRDVERVLTFFEGDAIRIVPGRTLKGREELRAAFERVAKADFKMLSLAFKTDELRVTGDFAWETGVSTGENERADGKRIPWTGRYLTVWHRGTDGRWRVQSDASFPDPPPKS
jgi:uncharacterized protein (TIGR02246 family)